MDLVLAGAVILLRALDFGRLCAKHAPYFCLELAFGFERPWPTKDKN